jgi:hypothetical protein
MGAVMFENLGKQVECRYAWDWRWSAPFGEGRVVAYSDAPMVLIEDADGHKDWWRADLTRVKADYAQGREWTR